jgi:hypothetical protein
MRTNKINGEFDAFEIGYACGNNGLRLIMRLKNEWHDKAIFDGNLYD